MAATGHSTKGVRKVVYRPPELLKADHAATVFINEADQDCDNLAALGLVATTNAMGSATTRATPTHRRGNVPGKLDAAVSTSAASDEPSD
jgi:hypothetical protein